MKSRIVRKVILVFLVSFLMLAAVKTAWAQQTSTNWAGYVVNANGITAMSASWTIPTILCGTAEGPANTVSEGVSIWIGFDGLGTAVPEQLGTDAYCLNGSPLYYAWEEDPTLNSGGLSAFADSQLSGGDHITASIAYLGNSQFQLKIADLQTSDSRTYHVIIRNAARASAEWIIEVAYNMNTGKYWTLPKFQPITFSDCSASVNNAVGSITQLNGEWMNMVDGNNHTIATPQGLNQAGNSFSVAEVSPVPEFPNAMIALTSFFTVLVILRKRIAHSVQ